MNTKQRFAYAVLLILAFGSTAAFLGWWFQPGHVPHNFHHRWHIVDTVLFALLSAVFAHRLFMDGFSWIAAWGMRPAGSVPTPGAGHRVAFITTFVPSSEPLEILLRTLPAMRDVDYPHDTWVLDEGGDEQVRALCHSLGVKYFSRSGVRKYNLIAGPFTARTKGGNHNAWYDEVGHQYDFVAQIDSDFVPSRHFLTRTLGYFQDERVGFVGTPQVYGNGRKSFVALGAAQQLYMFYGAIMRGLGSRGSANMIGANHVVRVAALGEIGLYAGHLTEDLLTGMRLHARGWRSHYVAEPLAIGEGPETWQAYFNQQMRWAFGCMDILRRYSVVLTRTMRLRQRLLYLALQQHYFSGIAAAVGLTLLIGYFVAGVSPANVPVVATILWCAPLVIIRQVVVLWLQRFNPSSRNRGLLLAGRYLSTVVWPIYLLAAVGVARQRRLVFKVTPKGSGQRGAEPLAVMLPHVIVAAVCIGCLIIGELSGRLAVAMVFWAAANAAIMSTFVLVLLAKRWDRQRVRVRMRAAVTFGWRLRTSAMADAAAD